MRLPTEGGVEKEDAADEEDDDDDAKVVGVECYAWMAIKEIRTNRWGFARTASFVLPHVVSKLILEGVELGEADDRVFGRTNSKQEDGSVGLLTRGIIDRTEYYVHALTLALVPFMNREVYFERSARKGSEGGAKSALCASAGSAE